MSRDRIIERERRWALPAAIVAFLPLVLGVAYGLLPSAAGVETTGSAADQLRSVHDHAATVLGAGVLIALALLAVAAPLLYLFRAAQARSPRVHSAFVGFVFLGPLLLATAAVVQSVAQTEIAAEYPSRAADEQEISLKNFRQQVTRNPDSVSEVTIYTDRDALEVESSGGEFSTASYPAEQEQRIQDLLDRQAIDITTDSSGYPGDALAADVTSGSTTNQISQGLGLPGALGTIFAIVYTCLHAMRTGLLRRFFGSLGIALGAVQVFPILPFRVGLLLWFGYLGLLFVGRVPGGRPPAWDAGEAIPWPRPGEEQPEPRRAPDAIDGEATEVEAGGQAEPGGEPGSAKRKRKRRR